MAGMGVVIMRKSWRMVGQVGQVGHIALFHWGFLLSDLAN